MKFIDILLCFVPALAAGGLIFLLKKSVPALVLVTFLLALSVGKTAIILFPRDYFSNISPTLIGILLLIAGVYHINSGPAKGMAQNMVSRIKNPHLQYFLVMILSALVGFGSSTTAVNFLSEIMGKDEKNDKQNHINLAPIVAGCTFGCICLPISAWWTFFGGLLPSESCRGLMTYAFPIFFSVVCMCLMGRGIFSQQTEQKSRRDVRRLLRTADDKSTKNNYSSAIIFFGIIIFIPIIFGAIDKLFPHIHAQLQTYIKTGMSVVDQQFVDNMLPKMQMMTCVLIATSLASIIWVIHDLRGTVQSLWNEGNAKIRGRSAALDVILQKSPTAFAAVMTPNGLHAIAESSAASATHIVLRKPSHDLFSIFLRIQISLTAQWAQWEKGAMAGVSACLVILCVSAFNTVYKSFLSAYSISLSSPNPLIAFWCSLFVILILGLIGGYFIGSSFGTFAITIAVISPNIASLIALHHILSAQILIGLLVCVSALVNSCSLQADNVNIAANLLGVSTETLSKAAMPVLLSSFFATLAFALVIFFLTLS